MFTWNQLVSGVMILAFVVCFLGSVLAEGTTTVTPSIQCKYNFIVPPADIVNTCRDISAQERKILERQVVDLQQQVASLSQGKAANFSTSVNPHFACDCEKNSTFQFAFQDCQDVAVLAGRVSGVYEITPIISTSQLLVVKDASKKGNSSAYLLANTSQSIKVYCDLHDDVLSWTVLMRRRKMNVSFDRTWNEYEKGFGDVENGGDFWIGLDTMHKLTSNSRVKYMLWVVLTDENRVPHVVRFTSFSISSGDTGYTFRYKSYKSTTQMNIQQNRAFVAKDYDPYELDVTTPHRSYSRGQWKDCVTTGTNTKGGGWWFEDTSYRYDSDKDCGDANLNAPKPYWEGLTVKAVEMKIRPSDE